MYNIFLTVGVNSCRRFPFGVIPLGEETSLCLLGLLFFGVLNGEGGAQLFLVKGILFQGSPEIDPTCMSKNLEQWK